MAVGYRFDGAVTRNLVRTRGKAWKVVAAPGGADTSELDGVAMTSASNGWAAGWFFDGSANHAVLLHWNGHRWSKQPLPTNGTADELHGVAGTLGEGGVGGRLVGEHRDQALALHCC